MAAGTLVLLATMTRPVTKLLALVSAVLHATPTATVGAVGLERVGLKRLPPASGGEAVLGGVGLVLVLRWVRGCRKWNWSTTMLRTRIGGRRESIARLSHWSR